MKNVRGLAWRYLRGQWKRTFLAVAGIILSVALITAIGTMMVAFRDHLIRSTAADTGDYYIQYVDVEGSRVDAIRSAGEVAQAAVIAKEGDAIIAPTSDRERAGADKVPPYRYIKLRSYDATALSMFTIPLEEGRLPKAPGELLVDAWVPQHLPGHPGVGDKVTLAIGSRWQDNGMPVDEYDWVRDEVFREQSEAEYTIVGLTKTRAASSANYLANGIAFLDSRHLHADREYQLYVKTDSVRGVTEKGEAIAKAAGLEKQRDENGSLTYPIKYNDKLLRLSAQSTSSSLNSGLVMIVGFLILLATVCTVAVIYNAFNISVLERVSQFGVLQCVGATPGQIRGIVLREAGILSLLGIPLGLVCGVFAVKVVLYAVNSLDNNPLVFLKDLEPGFTLPVLIASTVLGLVTVYLSALGPARQAARVSPLEAVKNAGAYHKEGFKKKRGSGLVAVLFGIEGQMAVKNLQRNRKRFRITVFSMVIGIVLYIVFGSFVDYVFRAGAAGGGANADFILSMSEGSGQYLAEETYEEIKNLPHVQSVYKNMSTDVTLRVPEEKINPRFAELKAELLNDKDEDLTRYPKAKLYAYGEAAIPDIQRILNENDLDAMNRENGVILVSTSRVYDPADKKMAIVDAFRYKVGDQIGISVRPPGQESEDTEVQTVKVVGILEKPFLENQYNGDGDVYLITTEETYRGITGDDRYSQVAIRLGDQAGHEPVANYLQQLVERDATYEYVDVFEMMSGMRTAALTISVFLYGFVAVIALIGSLNIVNTISTNLILRTRELSVLKAVGMTQGGVKRLVCMEGVLYGLAAAVYGGVIGTILSYLLFKVFQQNIMEFAWAVPWGHIFAAGLGSVLIALVSGYIPLKRIERGVISQNLKNNL